MITHESTYDEVVAYIDAAAEEVAADSAYDGAEINPDDIWHDLAISMLSDADPAVAREVGRCQLGWEEQDFKQYRIG